MKWKYMCCDEMLCIQDLKTGQVVWQGKPDGHSVQKVMTIPDSNDCVLLLNPGSGWRPFANLWRYSFETGVIWQAELPSLAGGDAYIDFELDESGLSARSWSSFRVTLDLASGRILLSRFTK